MTLSNRCKGLRGEILFPRIDVAKELAALEAMNENKNEKKEEKKEEEPDNLITIDEFARVEMKVALVEEASVVEGSDKLLLLKLDLGNEKRQVVSGIAKYYTPEEILREGCLCDEPEARCS